MGKTILPNQKSLTKICSVSGCDLVVSCKEMCEKHYCRVRRHGDPNTVLVVRVTEQTFWAQVDKTAGYGPKGECWKWGGCLDPTGYGVSNFQGEHWRAHRLAWFLTFNEDADGFLLHSCDVRDCVNPSHLRLGTPAENSLDMRTRNRQSKKLTWAVVNQIREEIAAGAGIRATGRKYSIGHRSFLDIRDEITWQPPPPTQTE